MAKSGLNANVVTNKPGASNIAVRNLRVDGAASNQSLSANPCHALAFYGVNGVLVENCELFNTRLDGLYVAGGTQNVTVRDISIHDVWRNWFSATDAHGVTLDNVTAWANNVGAQFDPLFFAAGIDFESNNITTQPVYDFEVANCNLTAEHAPAIGLYNVSHEGTLARIHHNTIAQAGAYRPITVFCPCDGLTIEHNTLETQAGGVWINPQSDIGARNVTIANNWLTGVDTPLYPGVGLNYVVGGAVNANVITDFATAVLVASESDTIAVTDNTFASCANGVDVTGGAVNVTQSGNEVLP